MAYGQSILSNVPADWVVTNCELTSSTMTLHANGSALLNITIDMIEKLPETAEVTIVAGAYSIYNRVEVIAVLQDNTYVVHTLPIVDVGNGIYKTIIDFPEEPYSSFIFKVTSKEGVEITEWSLATPVSADFTEVIDGVKQEIPKLLWDYNTYPFQVSQEEETIGMISAKLFKNVDLQGHLQINCTASEDSTIVVRISDNEIQELYSPIEFNVKRGRNAIGIPHAYIGRKIGIHNFLVTMQVKTGTVTVETRGFLYTIDGGYLAQRILDVGYEVHDIAIKQLPTDMDPSEIYAVCIDDGKALIRKRAYNEEVAVAWVPEYIIEDAVEACIEFNGLWILRDGEIGFTLETDEQPYVMWIDPDGVLWSQYGPDVSTKFQMATGVSYMSCCMSYNYAPEIQYDQGLMCVYIRSGVVYYKNLCRQDLVGTLVWSAEREITLLGSGNTLVSVARLNDYRCAINAINSKSQWLLSDRSYVGQAAKPEQFFTRQLPSYISGITQLEVRTVIAPTQEEQNFASTQFIREVPISIVQTGATTTTYPVLTQISASWLSSNECIVEFSLPIILYANYLDNFELLINTKQLGVINSILPETATSIRVCVQLTDNALDSYTLKMLGKAVVHYKAGGYQFIAPPMDIVIPNPLTSKQENFTARQLITQLSSVTPYAVTITSHTCVDSPQFSARQLVSTVSAITQSAVGTVPV